MCGNPLLTRYTYSSDFQTLWSRPKSNLPEGLQNTPPSFEVSDGAESGNKDSIAQKFDLFAFFEVAGHYEKKVNITKFGHVGRSLVWLKIRRALKNFLVEYQQIFPSIQMWKFFS